MNTICPKCNRAVQEIQYFNSGRGLAIHASKPGLKGSVEITDCCDLSSVELAGLIAQQKQTLMETAQLAHEQYPQYSGCWAAADWKLVRVNRQVKTKLGVAFEAGDISLGRRNWLLGDWTVYSVRNQINTVLDGSVTDLEK